MSGFASNVRWGNPPWVIDFHPAQKSIPGKVDFAVIGGGFSGLSAAAWLQRMNPTQSVALFEAGSIGAGSSGYTGGMVLAETAAGDLPGLGDVLAGYSAILKDLAVDCDLTLPGVFELGRQNVLFDSPISWTDSGTLRAVKQVPGGTIDPGKIVGGLASSAETSGVLIFENAFVEDIKFEDPVCLSVAGKQILANAVVMATNAMSLELSGLIRRSQPKFTLALCTESLSETQIQELGLRSRRPFYTIDFPYLWGRLLPENNIVFGSGLVALNDWRGLSELDIAEGQAAELMQRLERRVLGLHPALKDVRIAHRWGGPILIPEQWRPVFARHPRSSHVLVLGGYSGHGVALSVYLGRWAAEFLSGRKALPDWDAVGETV